MAAPTHSRVPGPTAPGTPRARHRRRCRSDPRGGDRRGGIGRVSGELAEFPRIDSFGPYQWTVADPIWSCSQARPVDHRRTGPCLDAEGDRVAVYGAPSVCHKGVVDVVIGHVALVVESPTDQLDRDDQPPLAAEAEQQLDLPGATPTQDAEKVMSTPNVASQRGRRTAPPARTAAGWPRRRAIRQPGWRGGRLRRGASSVGP